MTPWIAGELSELMSAEMRIGWCFASGRAFSHGILSSFCHESPMGEVTEKPVARLACVAAASLRIQAARLGNAVWVVSHAQLHGSDANTLRTGKESHG